jgi:hypothetical protein
MATNQKCCCKGKKMNMTGARSGRIIMGKDELGDRVLEPKET